MKRLINKIYIYYKGTNINVVDIKNSEDYIHIIR